MLLWPPHCFCTVEIGQYRKWLGDHFQRALLAKKTTLAKVKSASLGENGPEVSSLDPMFAGLHVKQISAKEPEVGSLGPTFNIIYTQKVMFQIFSVWNEVDEYSCQAKAIFFRFSTFCLSRQKCHGCHTDVFIGSCGNILIAPILQSGAACGTGTNSSMVA